MVNDISGLNVNGYMKSFVLRNAVNFGVITLITDRWFIYLSLVCSYCFRILHKYMFINEDLSFSDNKYTCKQLCKINFIKTVMVNVVTPPLFSKKKKKEKWKLQNVGLHVATQYHDPGYVICLFVFWLQISPIGNK